MSQMTKIEFRLASRIAVLETSVHFVLKAFSGDASFSLEDWEKERRKSLWRICERPLGDLFCEKCLCWVQPEFTKNGRCPACGGKVVA